MRAGLTILIVPAAALSGCAINVPPLGGRIGTPTSHELWEGALVDHVECELRIALKSAKTEWLSQPPKRDGSPRDPFFMDGRGAKVNLTMQVDVKSSTNPSLSWTEPLQNALRTFPENGNVTIARNHALGSA